MAGDSPDQFPVPPIDGKADHDPDEPDDAKPARKSSSKSSSKAKPSKSEPAKRSVGRPSKASTEAARLAELERIESSIHKAVGKAGGMLLGSPLQLPGAFLLTNGDDLAAAGVAFASHSPKMLKQLQKGEVIVDGIVLGGIAAGFLLSIAVQFGLVAYDSPPAQALGVTEVAEELRAMQERADAEERARSNGDATTTTIGEDLAPAPTLA